MRLALIHSRPPTQRTWNQPVEVPTPQTGPPCGCCDRLAGDAFVCPQCMDWCEVFLADCPALLHELGVQARHEARTSKRDRKRTKPPAAHTIATLAMRIRPDADPESIVTYERIIGDTVERAKAILGRGRPDDPRAADLKHEIESHLATSARMLCERRGIAYDGDPTPVGVSRWLMRYAGGIAQDVGGPDIVAGLSRLHLAAMRHIDNDPEAVSVGNCASCGAALFAAPGNKSVECEGCGTVNTADDLEAARWERIGTVLQTTGGLVRLASAVGLKVTKRRVHYLVAAGRLQEVGHTTDGYPLYRMADLMAIEDTRAG